MGISTILCDIDNIITYAQSVVPDGYELDGDILEQIAEFFENMLDHQVRMNIITQFDEPWSYVRGDTRIKVELDEVVITEVSNPWVSVMYALNVDPDSVLAITDTIQDGLWRAHEAGIRKFLWIDKPVMRSRIMSRTPRNTVCVNEIMDIIPCLMKVPWK